MTMRKINSFFNHALRSADHTQGPVFFQSYVASFVLRLTYLL
jgi:hypothetical protein